MRLGLFGEETSLGHPGYVTKKSVQQAKKFLGKFTVGQSRMFLGKFTVCCFRMFLGKFINSMMDKN
jgi:hypothetical protein